MDCDELLDWLQHYLAGELPQWRKQAAARHLDDCPPCAQGYRVEVRLRQIVASKCVEQAPYNLRVRIVEAIGSVPADDAEAPGTSAPTEA
jgi:anti-sigma factor (TIGR02949 family)